MCGIVGILQLDGAPVSEHLLEDMTNTLVHRGPDGAGVFTDENVGLGHRRLAIIDLSQAGAQPMHTRDGRYIITFNGAIYNFRELRIELEAAGYKFRSQSDTEVLLNAYSEWGERCIDRFNGMFAFAIWDRSERRLFLARDRYGIKPLYVYYDSNRVIFASEAKAILKHPSIKTSIDKKALLEYFTFQNLFTSKTFFENIQLIPQGTCGIVDMGSTQPALTMRQYWDFEFSEPVGARSDKQYLEEADFLFQQAVQRQLVSDAPLGTYLSGGMDSGSITAIAASKIPYIKSFTCGFDLSSASGIELNFDERKAAEQMSYEFLTEHYEMVLKSGDMERVLPELAYHLEEPRIGQSYPNYYVAKLASKFVKVVLSGTGGDEMFGGYPWRYYRAVVNDDFEHYVDKYYRFWQRLIPNRDIQKVFNPIWKDVEDVWTRDIFADVFTRRPEGLRTPEEYLNHSMYFEAKTFLHGLLIVEDKLSMAHSLESRVPFLDNDLVDFAMKLPAHLKLGKLAEVVRINENEVGDKTASYFQKTRDGKLLLRKMMRKYIPIEVTEREKQGFSAPDASWFKGESIEFVRRNILNENARIYEYLDYGTVNDLVQEHLDGRSNRRLLLWSLLNVEEVLKQYFENDSSVVH